MTYPFHLVKGQEIMPKFYFTSLTAEHWDASKHFLICYTNFTAYPMCQNLLLATVMSSGN